MVEETTLNAILLKGKHISIKREEESLKTLFLLLLLVNISYAKFQTVSIGTIDKHYKNILSKEQLLVIIKDIDSLFESQLGFNVFDYCDDGKRIDILYLPPSKKKKKLLRDLEKSTSLKDQIDALQSYLSTTQKSSKLLKEQLNNEYLRLNQSIEDLNGVINKTKQTMHEISKAAYDDIQTEISTKKITIEKKQSSLEKRKKQFNRSVAALKQKIRKYNLLIGRYNRVHRDVEKLSSTLIEIKGVTRGEIKTAYKNYIEDGEISVKKSTDTHMKKIEIYSFDNLQQLKVVLAHELGHLAGVKHIDIDNALMNPLLQKKQLEELSLTYDDVQAFYEAFE